MPQRTRAGFGPWQLVEEHGLALERQAEEHHRSEAEQNHSEGLFELLALKRVQQENLRLTQGDRPPLARIQEALEALTPLHMYEMDLLAQRCSNDEDVAEMVAKLRTRPSAREPDGCSLTLTQVSEPA